ncbi:MAG TPA: carboxy terminal-processing peptidase [Thermoguttaceae bacterium]|nr:carboxy terminal-processing peptidase [Thermoguttaceae bacterium]
MIRRATYLRVGVLGVSAAAVVLVAVLSQAWADPVGPTAPDREIARAVVSLLERDHLLQHPLDDEIAERWFKAYFDALDPRKMFFYQSDVDEFKKSADKLDDMVRHYDLSFGYQVYSRFLERVDESMKMVERALAMKHDFTVDEDIVIDAKDVEYAKTPEEAQDRWRKRIKYELLLLKADDKIEGKEAIEKLRRRYQYYTMWKHRLSNADLREIVLSSMTQALDPHTSYMSPTSSEEFAINLRLEFDGIGATLQADDGDVVVRDLVPGGAADKDGRLKTGDKIVGVGQGTEGDVIDIGEMTLTEAVKLIRGPRGTTVRLQVKPVAGGPRKVLDIVRSKIELKNREAHGQVFPVGRKPDGQSYKIGVINLPSFYMDMLGHRRGQPDYVSATRDVQRILEGFKKDGVDAVVLDMRFNGGGALIEAIQMTGLFIEQGPVVQVKGAAGRPWPHRDDDPGVAWSGPLVLLVNKFSASATEILAGAIQDYHRGLIIGDRTTHGKGTVQSQLDVAQEQALFRIPNSPDLGTIKITIQQYYRPSGDSVQLRGVHSDVELPSWTSHLEVGEEDTEYPIPFDQVDPTPFSKLDCVTKPICDRLAQLSAERCKASKDFQKVDRNIKRLEDRKKQKTETLNEAKFMAEWNSLNEDREEEKKLEEKTDPNSTEIVRDFYLDEVFAITLDYLQMVNVAQTR